MFVQSSTNTIAKFHTIAASQVELPRRLTKLGAASPNQQIRRNSKLHKMRKNCAPTPSIFLGFVFPFSLRVGANVFLQTLSHHRIE